MLNAPEPMSIAENSRHPTAVPRFPVNGRSLEVNVWPLRHKIRLQPILVVTIPKATARWWQAAPGTEQNAPALAVVFRRQLVKTITVQTSAQPYLDAGGMG